MKDTQFSELEAELRGLRPRPPSDLLAARVEAALGAPAGRSRRWWPLLPLAAAAGLALALILAPGVSPQGDSGEAARADASAAPARSARSGPAAPRPASETKATLEPISEVGFLYAAQDEGLILAPDATPFRRIRYRVLDTREYRDPVEDAVIRVAIPREDVMLVPTDVY